MRVCVGPVNCSAQEGEEERRGEENDAFVAHGGCCRNDGESVVFAAVRKPDIWCETCGLAGQRMPTSIAHDFIRGIRHNRRPATIDDFCRRQYIGLGIKQ